MWKADFKSLMELENKGRTNWFIKSDDAVIFLKSLTEEEVHTFIAVRTFLLGNFSAKMVPLIEATKEVFEKIHAVAAKQGFDSSMTMF